MKQSVVLESKFVQMKVSCDRWGDKNDGLNTKGEKERQKKVRTDMKERARMIVKNQAKIRFFAI